MLHARTRGETFGLACGEFAISGKPIVTYGQSIERAHLDILEGKYCAYSNELELMNIFNEQSWKRIDMSTNGYMNYTPEKVMYVFQTVFLS
jgi:hypothetical protein